MSRLPVIVGFGGINAAGRSSFHQGYRRLVLDALDPATRDRTVAGLARLMGLPPSADTAAQVLRHTLVRRIEPQYFNVDAAPLHQRLHAEGDTLRFRLARRDLPHTPPANWRVEPLDEDSVHVTVTGTLEALVADHRPFPVSSAGQLPTGFDPAAHYPSRHHPRALQLTVFGASDALASLGVAWDDLRTRIAPDRIAVFAASAHGQVDDDGVGGLLKSPWLGRRTSARQCPLGFAEMPADFINAYLLGSAGRTGGTLGACATFLYNLERAVTLIRDGEVDLAVVGAAEAPILPEVMEGYRAMGALGEDSRLLELDRARGATVVDNRRATRPFSDNAGFTIAESAQFVVLASDALALAEGLPVHAAVPGVYIHADGYKKSISAPGIGNYLTFGKAAGLARELLGEERLRRATYVQAHGTGTPQNRVTESHVFDTIADAFGIDDWLVASVKCYVGHSLGAAAGDQVMAALGAWAGGWIPGIFTLDAVAPDVHRRHLRFSQGHVACGPRDMAACLVNSKGFGGNNATALLLGPAEAEDMLRRRHGREALLAWARRREATEPGRQEAEARADEGRPLVRYRFGEAVLAGDDLAVGPDGLRLPGLPLSAAFFPGEAYSAYREGEPAKEKS
ncbi:MAG TPA: beta-ketoacyl synthase [Moraxellaceae bacterium]|nr:beta-ketoacyl synthase [Moraxellaceae bacterium]